VLARVSAMTRRRMRVHGGSGGGLEVLDRAFALIRADLQVPTRFDDDVLAEADRAAGAPDLPDVDLTALPFFTVDPPGSTDLDQAMHLERTPDGYRVRYAIADVPAFVPAGGLVDVEARRRGQTLYAPDGRTPLHPPVLSEDAASLLPGQVRPAFVWDLMLDAEGEVRSAEVARAMVRSVERLDYEAVQRSVDAGEERFAVLREVGQRRLALEAQRGGASLAVPEQEVVEEDGRYVLHRRANLPAEGWNAQVSLLTGMAAADIMLAGQVGVLRTLPAPDGGALARFRRQAVALGTRWPAEQGYGDFLRTLDPSVPGQLALLHEATALFRGAGYVTFDGAPPEYAEHAAVADQYAHVTAPLRRLVDRFGLVICAALCGGEDVPHWAREALPQLPEVMAASDRLARQLDRACTDAVEAVVLEPLVGQAFDAVVVDVKDGGGVVQVLEPAVLAPVVGRVELGGTLRVRLAMANVDGRHVVFNPA
jgi:exoribonuclease R